MAWKDAELKAEVNYVWDVSDVNDTVGGNTFAVAKEPVCMEWMGPRVREVSTAMVSWW